MILLRDNFEQKVEATHVDENGNYILLDIVMYEKRITLANIYGPNGDNPEFYENIFKKIRDINNDYTVIGGDWNMIINPSIDCENYININNPRSRSIVLREISNNNYIDVWRTMHEDKRQYTWIRNNPVRKQSRLDFFLINQSTFNFTTETKIISSYRSDHKGIILKLKLLENKRGPGYWKFNNSLLKDDNYVKLVKQTLQNLINQHTLNEHIETEHISPEQVRLNINDQLFLETFLVILRGETIKFSSIKKVKSES
jgi:hypothetical protein